MHVESLNDSFFLLIHNTILSFFVYTKWYVISKNTPVCKARAQSVL